MELRELCEGIGLCSEAATVVYSMAKTDMVFEETRALYREDREAFYRMIACSGEPEKQLLYDYCRFACEAYGRYEEDGISDNIFFDTFRDITLWCMYYYGETGKYGIGRYVQDWFWRGFERKMLRLGRLEFEEMKVTEELAEIMGYAGREESVISIHIPAGEPLERKACLESLRRAYGRYGKERLYFCHSWLLYPELRKLLPEHSNILRFQELFDVVQVDYREREAEWRVFGRHFYRVADYAEDTFLRRHLKQHLLSGGVLGNGFGMLRKEKVSNF